MTAPLQKSSILLIYTGGTIGMRLDPADHVLRPFDFSQILEEVPELKKFAFRIDTRTFDPPIDSSDVEPGLWQRLAALIAECYERYDGFIVLHGTDTMAYSAAALSFMLEGLAKPVIFTGSQLPIGVPRTDGRENLITSVEIASAKEADGRALVPEVCIYFGNRLIRGNRATKVDADGFIAFRSANCPPLAEAGIQIRYNRSVLLRVDPGTPLRIHTDLDTRVSVLKIHPGITPQVVRDVLCGKETRAVILETFGSGNAPSRPWFLDLVREAHASGKVLVNITQCLAGTVNMGLYANGKTLAENGVVSGGDMTVECALAKLFCLLGAGLGPEETGAKMEQSLCGEITK